MCCFSLSMIMYDSSKKDPSFPQKVLGLKQSASYTLACTARRELLLETVIAASCVGCELRASQISLRVAGHIGTHVVML